MAIERDLRLVHPPPKDAPVLVPSEVLGTMIFVLTEIMMFAGFISAFHIAQASVPVWPPPGQPRLPVEATAVNTLLLLVSGGLAWWSGRRFDRAAPAAAGTGDRLGLAAARWPLRAAVILGVAFVALQGVEWVGLLGEGLTLSSSLHGAFFYTIVGAHAIHAVGGATVLAALAVQMERGTLTSNMFWAGRIFWSFVVLLWPVLYWQVYL
jgi:cytochrome c oxidase subunit 3